MADTGTSYVDENGDYVVPTSHVDETPVKSDAVSGAAPVTPPSQGYDQTAVTANDPQPQDPYSGVTPDQGGALVPPVRQQAARALDDVAGAAQDENAAIDASQISSFNADMAKHKAEAAKADAQSQVQQQYADHLGTIDAHEQAARDQAHKDAAIETASWMQQMDNLSKQEPNRARYWENQSGFGKAMWILGVAATAIANSGHPGMPNASLNLLQEQVQADVQDQKDRLNRQVETGKLKGKLMVDAQNQRLTDLHDDYAKEVTRYGALRDAAMTKASVYPPGTQQNLAWTTAAQQADQLRTQAASKKLQSTVQFKEQAITQAGENSRAAASRANSYAIARMEDNSKRDIANQTNKRDYDLAQERIDAAVAKKSAGNGDFEFKLPEQSGFHIVTPGVNGQPGTSRPLGIKKEQQKEAFEEATEYTNRLKQLKDFRKDVSDASTFSYLINSSSALDSKRIELGASIGKGLNGGRGPLNEGDQKRGEQVLGADFGSVFDKLKKGVDRKQVLELLDKKIAEVTGQAQYNIGNKYGTALDESKGEKLIFNPEEALKNYTSEAATPPGATEQEVKSGYGSEEVVPKTPEEYRKYRQEQETFGKGILRELPPEVGEKLNDAIDNMAHGDLTHVNRVSNGAKAALDAYAAKNPKLAPLVEDAKLRLTAETQDAVSLATKKIPEIERRVLSMAQYSSDHHLPNADDLEKELKHANLDNISAYRKSQMLNDINAALKVYATKQIELLKDNQFAGFKAADAIEGD